MGIWYGAKLIAGWEIDKQALFKFLLENNFPGCGEHDWKPDDVCWNCVESKEMKDLPLPVGFEIVRCDPYFDCNKKCQFFLSLDLDMTEISQLQSKINVDWDAGQRLAAQLGAKKSAKLFARPNVT